MSQNSNQPLSVAELCELPTDSWVNDGFTAVAEMIERRIAKKTQKPFWVCTMSDTTGSASVELAMFTAPKFNKGDQVDFLGQGIKFKTTEYGPKVSVGEKTEIHVVGKSVHHDEQVQRKEAGQPALNGDPQRIDGQTVGMSIKEAIALALAAHREPDASPPKPIRTILADTLFWADVKTYSGNIIRISRSLCNGHLSPPSWPVAKAETSGRTDPPKPVTKPEPGPEGSAFPPSEEAEDDIPF